MRGLNTLHEANINLTGVYAVYISIVLLTTGWRDIFSALQLLAPFC
jgi:hypothetical protein